MKMSPTFARRIADAPHQLRTAALSSSRMADTKGSMMPNQARHRHGPNAEDHAQEGLIVAALPSGALLSAGSPRRGAGGKASPRCTRNDHDAGNRKIREFREFSHNFHLGFVLRAASF